MNAQIIELENYEDAASVCDKMDLTHVSRLLFIWPEDAVQGMSRINLVLIRRHADAMGIQIALIARSHTIRAQARSAGIPAFQKVEQARRSVWRVGRSGKPRFERHPHPLLDMRDHLNDLQFGKPSWVYQKGVRLAFFVLRLLAVLALVTAFLPSAQIDLPERAVSQKVDLIIRADPAEKDVHLSGAIPAVIKTLILQSDDHIATTGKVPVPTQVSSGVVTFTNLTDQEVKVLKGSVVLGPSDTPIRFLVTRTGTVAPGPGKKLELPVQADLPGRQGNVLPGAIQSVEGALGFLVTATNEKAIGGGGDRIEPAPDLVDREQLRMKIMQSLRMKALDQFAKELLSDEQIIENSLREKQIITEAYEPDKALPATILALTLKVEFQVLTINQNDL
ncbi:MAG: baseplate J/gp47 family protein, partial [Anaerolineaceae bacterium]|nr:baseplate J/gp47 family protein [Anaerolineaceae bacterium]